MTANISILVALLLAGPAQGPGPVQPLMKKPRRVACYNSNSHQFIKEERQKLLVDGTGHAPAPWTSEKIREATRLLLEAIQDVINTIQNSYWISNKSPAQVLRQFRT